jgi:hypothetical protein
MTFCAGVGVLIMTIFFYYGISSMSLTFRLTTRAGISSDLRKEYAYGRILYLCIYMLCWIAYFALNYYILFLNVIIYSNFSLESVDRDPINSYEVILPESEAAQLKHLIWINVVSQLSTGVIMSCVRIFGAPDMIYQVRRLAY